MEGDGDEPVGDLTEMGSQRSGGKKKKRRTHDGEGEGEEEERVPRSSKIRTFAPGFWGIGGGREGVGMLC